MAAKYSRLTTSDEDIFTHPARISVQHLPDAVSICTPEARITSNPSSRPAFCSRAAIANHIHSAKASFLASYSPPYPFAASTSLLGQLCTNHIARYQLCIRQATLDPPYVPSHHRSPKSKARLDQTRPEERPASLASKQVSVSSASDSPAPIQLKNPQTSLTGSVFALPSPNVPPKSPKSRRLPGRHESKHPDQFGV